MNETRRYPIAYLVYESSHRCLDWRVVYITDVTLKLAQTPRLARQKMLRRAKASRPLAPRLICSPLDIDDRGFATWTATTFQRHPVQYSHTSPAKWRREPRVCLPSPPSLTMCECCSQARWRAKF